MAVDGKEFLADAEEKKLRAAGTAFDVILRALNEFSGNLDLWGRAAELAALQPLRMITEMRGIPREREPRGLKMTIQNFGLEDPDYVLGGDTR